MDILEFCTDRKNDKSDNTKKNLEWIINNASKKTSDITQNELELCINHVKNGNKFIDSDKFIDIIKKLKSNDDDNNDIGKIVETYDINYIINDIENTGSKDIKFTNERKDALRMILNVIKTTKYNFCGMYGYAGTGKTTLITEFMKYLILRKLANKIILTSPTHKALNVMKMKFSEELNNLMLSVNGHVENTFGDNLIKLKEYGIDISFETLHVLLEYSPDMIDGEKKFHKKTVSKKAISKISEYDIVIIDECSMIPINMLIDLFESVENLKKNINGFKKNVKIIFTGDPAQLPPVNETTSAIFIKSYKDIPFKSFVDNSPISVANVVSNDYLKNQYDIFVQKILGMKSITLKQIFRNSSSNVNEMCFNIRQWVTGETDKLQLTKYIGNGVYVCKAGDSIEKKLNSDWFKKCVDKFKTGNTSAIILTWTNKCSDSYNETIRKILLNKKDIAQYEEGDRLILRDFYNFDQSGEESERFYTSDQLKIVSLEKTTLVNKPLLESIPKNILQMSGYDEIVKKYKSFVNNINKLANHKYTVWRMGVNRISENDVNNDKIYNIFTIHESSSEKLNTDRKYIEDLIKYIDNSYKKTNRNQYKTIEKGLIKQLWKYYESVYISPYADVIFGYSITTHKSQGSTFRDIFVDANDISTNSDINVMKRCIYTSHTRCSNELNILI